MSERLAREHIAQVDLDEGYPHPKKRIAQGDAGMSEGAGIDDHESDAVAFGAVDLVDQFMFGIAVGRDEFMALSDALGFKLGFDFREAGGPIDGRLTAP